MKLSLNFRHHALIFSAFAIFIAGTYAVAFFWLGAKVKDTLKSAQADNTQALISATTSPDVILREKIFDNNKQIIYDDTMWPTENHALSSAFGPRLQASENYRYDFHRGIDIPGKSGIDLVYAIADGEVFRTYLEGALDNPYKGGGTVIVIKHTANKAIPVHGQSFKTYYSIYMHLDKILIPMVKKGGPYPKIKKGQSIGIVGQSGTTEYDHLHFEIRVGTSCSVEYQRAHPSSLCAKTFGSPKDPNINPFVLLGYPNNKTIKMEIMSKNPLRVKLTVDKNEPDFNQIKFSKGKETRLINLNRRIGIHPNIDSNYFNKIKILPHKFNAKSSAYELQFEISDWKDFDSIEATDIWGNGTKIVKQTI